MVIIAVALLVSLVGNWYLWRGLTGWWEFELANALPSAESEARLIMVTQKLHEEGRRENSGKMSAADPKQTFTPMRRESKR